MRRKVIWDYIGKNLFSLLTVFLGCVALGLSQLRVLPPDAIGPTTLALVIFLATSQLVDHARKLDRIETSIKDGFQDTITAVGGVSVIPLVEPEKGLQYLGTVKKQLVIFANQTRSQLQVGLMV